MRKLIYLLVAVSTFTLGVGAYFLWFYFVPIPVSMCELARHPDWYDGKIIRVEAPAIGAYSGITLYDEGCNPGESAAFIELDNGYLPKSEVRAFLVSSTPLIRKADVIVVGRFDKNASMGCFGPKFGIVATEIALQSTISFEPFPRVEE